MIAEELGYAIIRKIGTDEIYCEIELGHVLWFLNYIAFSYDSRYVAIAGRYPNDTEINGYYVGGLFMVYDMTEQKEIAKVRLPMLCGLPLSLKIVFMQLMIVIPYFYMETFAIMKI